MASGYQKLNGSLESATKGNPFLKQLLQAMMNWQNALTNVSGIDPRVPPGSVGTNSLQPPDVVSDFSVVGGNGVFRVSITAPVATIGILYYLVESSLTVPFSSSTSILTYGPTPSTYFEVTQPSVSRYWRVSCKFTNSDYGAVYNFIPLVASGV